MALMGWTLVHTEPDRERTGPGRLFRLLLLSGWWTHDSGGLQYLVSNTHRLCWQGTPDLSVRSFTAGCNDPQRLRPCEPGLSITTSRSAKVVLCTDLANM